MLCIPLRLPSPPTVGISQQLNGSLPSTSGPSSTSHWPTSTSRPSPILSTSSPSAVAFSTAINSNPAQTFTGGPSQTSRPNQPESVSFPDRQVACAPG